MPWTGVRSLDSDLSCINAGAEGSRCFELLVGSKVTHVFAVCCYCRGTHGLCEGKTYVNALDKLDRYLQEVGRCGSGWQKLRRLRG